MTHTSSTARQMRVARAAPSTSMAGRPNQPKISIPLSRMFSATVVLLMMATSRGWPMALVTDIRGWLMPVSRYDQPAMRRYFTPMSISTTSLVKMPISTCGIRMHISPKHRETSPQARTPMASTCATVRLSPLPQYWEDSTATAEVMPLMMIF